MGLHYHPSCAGESDSALRLPCLWAHCGALRNNVYHQHYGKPVDARISSNLRRPDTVIDNLEGERKARFQGALNVVEVPEPRDEPTRQGLSRFGALLDKLSFLSSDQPIALR